MGLFFRFKGTYVFKLSEVLSYYRNGEAPRYICPSLINLILDKKKWYQISFFSKITYGKFTPLVPRAFHNAYPAVFGKVFWGMNIQNWIRDPQITLKMCEGENIVKRRIILMETLIEKYGDRELVIKLE